MAATQHEEFMRQAIALSRRAGIEEKTGGCFGAVVVKDGAVLAEGYNHVYSKHDATAHAEIYAIRAAGKALGTWDLKGCTMYSSCEPCPLCTAAVYWSGLDKVYYAAGDGDIGVGREKSDPFQGGEHRKPAAERTTVPFVQMLQPEGRAVFEEFAALHAKTEE